MDSATERPRPNRISLFLAGLEAGVIASLWYLAWLGGAAVLQRRSFWTGENLLATVFYGSTAIRRGFGASTFSGIALYVALYGLLGAIFAIAARDRLPKLRLTLSGIIFGIGWYYLSFHLIWKAVAPLVTLLHIESTTLWGHAIYGAMLGRYPAYAARLADQPAGPAGGDRESAIGK